MLQQKPYLIEGLDCSGKKTVALLVKKQLENEFRLSVKIVMGPFVNSPLKTLDRFISNPNRFLQNGRIRKYLKQIVYTSGPIIDHFFFKPSKKYFSIKVSSHFRAEAKAIIDRDSFMIKSFKRFKNISINYQGATLLKTSFEIRILRHKGDVESGKTNKDEVKRFYNHNKSLFEEWDNILTDLMVNKINSVKIIQNENNDLLKVAMEVTEHIKTVYSL